MHPAQAAYELEASRQLRQYPQCSHQPRVIPTRYLARAQLLVLQQVSEIRSPATGPATDPPVRLGPMPWNAGISIGIDRRKLPVVGSCSTLPLGLGDCSAASVNDVCPRVGGTRAGVKSSVGRRQAATETRIRDLASWCAEIVGSPDGFESLNV
jgi:hypothetical protein